MADDLTLDEKIALCRMDLDSPDFPVWAKTARRHQLKALLDERDRLRKQDETELERMYALPDGRYPHFMILRDPSVLDIAKAVIKRLAKAAHAYRKARGLE